MYDKIVCYFKTRINSRSYFIIYYVILLLFCNTKAINFSFRVPSLSNRCIGEYLTQSTIAIFKIESENKEFRVKLYDPNGHTVFNKV
jgi:hypothetical protein